MKQWIASERLVTICAIVKTWLSEPRLSVVSLRDKEFALQRKLHTNMRRAQLLGYLAQPGCSVRPASCVSGGSTLVVDIVLKDV